MKAIICTHYGPPEALELQEVAIPAPQADEVRVKVGAASLNAADWHIVRGAPALMRPMFGGLRKPKNPTPGSDIAGQVEAVGSAVKRFRVGDEVYGDLSGCGFGALAEYVCVPERVLAHKPKNLSFQEAAAVPMAGVTALQGLRNNGKIRAGQKVLINGASGGVGTFAVQIAKAYGADVTAVCSTRNVERVRALGADRVIDYKLKDFTQDNQRYDLIIAANGYHPLLAYRRALTPNGVYVVTGGALSQIFQGMLIGPLLSKLDGRSMGNLMAAPNSDDLAEMTSLIEAGKVRPCIDRTYPLEETAKALLYVEEGHAQGKVVISITE